MVVDSRVLGILALAIKGIYLAISANKPPVFDGSPTLAVVEIHLNGFSIGCTTGCFANDQPQRQVNWFPTLPKFLNVANLLEGQNSYTINQ